MKSKISVMVSIVLAMLVAAVDTTIMNTTMPVIAESLGSFDLFAWVFASYMIAMTVLSPVAGRLSDMFGRKRLFAFGIAVFLVGSLLCGLSQTMVQLVIFRGLQGIGAGFLMPFPAIIAGDLFPVEHRGKIYALTTGVWGLAAVVAPMLGAFFVEYMTWHWIFFVNIPVSVIALLTLWPYREDYEPKRAAVDYIGALIFGAGVSLLLLVTVAEAYHAVYGLLGGSALVGFYLFERKQASPLVPFSLYRHPTIRWMNINGFVAWVALFGTSSFIPLFLQHIGGLSVFMSGVALLGSAIGWTAASVPAGKWILRYGYRPLFIIGNIALVGSGVLLALLNEGHGFWYVFGTLVVQGFAFGLLSTTGVIGAQQLVGPHEKGISTSFMLFTRNIGMAIGVTIMGAFLVRAENFMLGIHHLFLYGCAVGFIALVTAFLIRDHGAEAGVEGGTAGAGAGRVILKWESYD